MAEASQPQQKDHILVLMAIDPSDNSAAAFEWYHEYLHRPEHRLLLIHVAEPPRVSSTNMYVDPDQFGTMIEEAKKKAEDLEKAYANRMRSKKLAGKVRALFHTKPGEALVQIAREEGANMIVTGTRGLGKVRRTIMGSVSDYVLHHASCPVVICRHATDLDLLHT